MEQELNSTIAENSPVDSRLLEEASQPFVGLWNRLVSNTNWGKGRIIQQWREALVASGSPATEYSDEAWSQRVGGVTGQHVGRLRRTYMRFGETHENFEGLYWSHFQAAVDWEDAEMWLEGAVQNTWSVSKMRHQRWETIGALDTEQPSDDEIVTSDLDEDFDPARNEPPQRTQITDVPDGPADEGPDFGEEPLDSSLPSGVIDHVAAAETDGPTESVDLVRPFQQVGELPEDIAEAFDAFKLVILHHKMAGWQDVACETVVAVLDGLKQLAQAPAEDA